MKARPFPENPMLVVDDDPGDVESLLTLLRSNGITNVLGCRTAARS